MAAAGLVGLEVDHPDHDADDRAHAAALAAELGLVAHRLVGLPRHATRRRRIGVVLDRARRPTSGCSTARPRCGPSGP